MGRGGRNAGQQPWAGGGNTFRVWPGAYSPQGPATRDRKPPWKADGRAPTDFPAYSSMQLPPDRSAPTGSAVTAMEAPGTMNTNSIQNALNITRKAETRLSRLRTAYQEIGAKMTGYEQKLKEALRRERARFARDQERLLRDIAEAEAAQETARIGLRAAFAEERSAAIGGFDVDMGDQDVDRLFAEWAREDSPAMDGVLRRALAPPPASGNPGSFMTPTRTTAAAPPRTPPATADPYLGAPSPFHAPPGLTSPNPAQNPVAPVVSAGGAAPPPLAPAELVDSGAPVAAPAADGGFGPSPTLSDRVRRRRALEPFGGIRPGGESGGRGNADRGLSLEAAQAAIAAGRPVRLVEDDNDEELADSGVSELPFPLLPSTIVALFLRASHEWALGIFFAYATLTPDPGEPNVDSGGAMGSNQVRLPPDSITSEYRASVEADIASKGSSTRHTVPSWPQDCLSAVLFDVRAMTGKVFADVLPRQTSLQRPTPWLSIDPIPSTARALCVLILHESGKFLFSDFVQCDWQNALRVTHFVGVEMSESRLVSAAGLASYIYHGTHVRGVIAVLGRSTTRDQQNRPLPAVFFLDGRPIGQDVNFCVMDSYYVSREFLRGRVQCRPPPGHRLAVMGGQLRDNGFEFHGGEVLTLAYLPDDDDPFEALESEPDGSDDPFDSPHGAFVVKLGATPSLHALVSDSSRGDGPTRLPELRDINDRSTRWQPPDLTIAAPEFIENPPALAPLRALFVVLCEDYRPEVIPLTFWQPVDYFLAIREVQTLRLPDVRRHFPRLLAIEPQPCTQFAVLLGFTGLPGPFCDIVFDCRAVGGYVFAGHADSEAHRSELLAIAGYAHRFDIDVWVPSVRGPLPDHQRAGLFTGSLVSLAPRGIVPPRLAPLADMLRRPDMWNARAEVPFASDPGVWLLTDEGPSFYAIPIGALLLPPFLWSLRGPCPRGFQLIADGAPRIFSRDRNTGTQVCAFGQASHNGGGENPPAGPPPPGPHEPPHDPLDVLTALVLSPALRAASPCGLLCVMLYASPVLTASVALPTDDATARDAGPLFRADTCACLLHHFLVASLPVILYKNLGVAWPFFPANLAALFEPDLDEPNEHDTARPVRVSFAVLIPNYPPELGQVDLELPCTPDEAIEAIQAARSTASYIRFPFLTPASPQSVVGHAVVLAAPRWAPMIMTVLINTSGIDGRIFACHAPDYADCEVLIALADLPPQGDYHIFAGDDDQPLDDGAQAHLFPGIQISFTFADQQPEVGLPFARTLLLPDAWGHDTPFPQVVIDHAYCVVHENRFVLHIENYRNPFRFRINLARRIGVDDREKAPISTVLPGSSRLTRPRDGCSVIIVDYMPVLAPAEDHRTLLARPLLHLGKGHKGTMESHRTALTVKPLAEYALDYTTELIEARVPVGTQPSVALLYVSQVRNNRDRERFPIWCAVEPQPLGAQALLLALLLWAPDGAIAAFDLTGVDGRLFALQIGRHVTRAGLLQAAELPDDPRFDVFVGTMPWAIPPTTPVDIKHGDLVQITFAGRGPSVVSSFADMLRSERGWNPDLTFIRAFSGWNLDDAWVLNEDRPFLLHVSAARRRYVRQDLALRLRIPVDELILRPPQPRIVDFSHCGWVTCSVLYAAGTANGQHYAAIRDPFCFIDLRPILRGFCTHIWYGQQEVDPSRLDIQVEGPDGGTSGDPDPFRKHRPDLMPVLDKQARTSAAPAPHWHTGFAVCTGASPSSIRGPLLSPGVGPVPGDPGSVAGQQQPPEQGDHVVFETLLEESSRDSNGYPFYLAATLLETLVDHFADGALISAGTHASPAAARPLVLLLDSVVPCTPYNIPPVPPTPLQLGTLLRRLHVSPEPLLLGGTPLGFTSEQISLFLQPAVCFGTLSDLLAALPPRRAHSLRALLGWACVFIDVALLCISIVSGPAPPWFLDLSVAPSAFVAECMALTAATWVGCTAFHGQSIHFLSDCQSAIRVAAGEVSSYTSEVALVLRRTAACFEVLQGSPLVFDYVPGHQGHFGNEVADITAKLASRGCTVGQLVWKETGGSHPLDWWSAGAPRVEWCGVAARALIGDTAMPPLGSVPGDVRDDLGMTPQQMLAPFCPQKPATTPEGGAGDGALAFSIATYNVLSLSGRAFEDRDPAGLAFSAGRPALLAASLDKADIQVADFCEPRASCVSPLAVKLVALVSSSGLRRDSPCFAVAMLATMPPPSAEKHSLLPIAIVVALSFTFIVGTEADKLHEWWERTITLLKHAATRAPLVLGGDFNAAVGSQCCSRIGDCWPEEQDVAGAFLAELVTTCQCWLPSTWGHLHSGQSWTYVQKRNNALQRPDFVCLPDCWESARVLSWVDPEIHVGQPYIDHFAAVVRVAARLRLAGGGLGTRKPARIDAHALVDRSNRPKLQAIVDKAPRAPWNASADAHAAQLVGYLQGALAEAFPKPKQRKRRDYLTDDTWALYAQVAALRHRCARLRAYTQYHLLAAAFRAWSTRGAEAFENALASPWALDASVQGQRHRDALRGLSKQLKHACRTDRARHLSSLADEVQANTPGSFQALNRLLSLKQKKPFAPEVLPEVLDADGRVCETPAEATKRWRTYFGDMESGVQKDADGVYQVVAARQGLAWPLPEDVTEIPGPAELRKAMAHTQLNKASGPDGIPGEAFKAMPAALSSLVLPLVLKLGLSGEEAAGLKGALLTWLYKFKGARVYIPVVTHRGSRPGSSLADIMYSAGVGCIIAKRDSLRTADPNAGRVPCIPWDGRRDVSPAGAPTQWPSLSDVIWADDLAACFLLSDSARAAHQVGLEASFLDEAFGCHGYTLTYGASKTAAMVLLGGRGSKAAKRALFSRAGAVTVLREHHPAAPLPLVAQYKHLGVMVGTSFLTELRARCASAWAAFRQGRVRAYRCRRISVARRGALLRAMVLPRLLFGAGAWPSLRQGEHALLHRTLVSMYRQTLCIPRTEDQHITGATMCALLHLPDPATVLRVERLRYLRQLVQAAPDALWALVRSSPSFLAVVRDAMAWLHRRLSATIPLGDPACEWHAWADTMCRAPGRFRGWIKRAAALEMLRLTSHAALQACHRFLSHFCPGAGDASYSERKRPTEACIPCRKAFADRVSWACHASKVHGYRTRATETTRGCQQAWCSGCGKLFANANRMKRHVFVTPACQAAWGSQVDLLHWICELMLRSLAATLDFWLHFLGWMQTMN
ncbi:unnamed protein product, partial [Symbiodinium necroappetens]